MIIALIFASLSAVCMALMIITDRIMVGDCYRGNSHHAWFVSSLAGSTLGLLLTAVVWVFGSFVGKVPDVDILIARAQDIFLWKGVITIGVGALGVQILLHYFRCFGEDAHSSVIAAWIAATPVFVFVASFVLEYVLGVSTGLTLTDPLWFVGMIMATIGLVWFERLTGGPRGRIGVYRKELVTLLALSVVYTIALKEIFSFETNDAFIEAVALMPFYWIGFGAGIRSIFWSGEWQSFRSNWRKRIKFFLVPILLLEVIGMLVFFFEYLSLTDLDPTTVSVILGTHVLLVYFLEVLLGRVRTRMATQGIQKMYFAGIRLVQHKLPEERIHPDMIIREIATIAIIMIGISLVTIYL